MRTILLSSVAGSGRSRGLVPCWAGVVCGKLQRGTKHPGINFMRVLQVTPIYAPSIGGIQGVVRSLAQSLVRAE
jgi:hypothetical protein